MRSCERAGGGEGPGLAVDEVWRRSPSNLARTTPAASTTTAESEIAATVAGLVAHLRLDVDLGGPGFQIDVPGVHIDAGGLEIFVEREGLVELTRDVQPNVVVEAAEVGVEGPAHPLVTAMPVASSL